MALVEPGELEAFLVLAEELHFGRTAERRQISPQRVSQIIQALERRIGGALFERTSRQVTLTPLGRQFRDNLQPHYEGIQHAMACATATARGVSCTLRVGVFSALWAKLIVDAADILRTRKPAIELAVHEISASDGYGPLLREEVEVMNVSLPVHEPGITVGSVLVEEPRVLAITAHHPLATMESIDLEDLAQTPLLTAPYMPGYWNEDRAPSHTPSGRPIERGPHIDSLSEGLALIAAGKGAFPFGAHMAQYNRFPGVVYRPLRNAPRIQWALASTPGVSPTRLRELTEAIRAAVT